MFHRSFQGTKTAFAQQHLNKISKLSPNSKLVLRNFSSTSAIEEDKKNPQLLTFRNEINSLQLSDAVNSFQNLIKHKKITNVPYSDMKNFLLLLCRHKSNADFALSSNKLTQLVDAALEDIKQRSIQFDEGIYSVLLRFYTSVGNFSRAASLFDEMLAKNITINVESTVSMIICYKKIGNLDKCVKLYQEAQYKFKNLAYAKYLASRTILGVYIQLQRIEDAQRLFRDILAIGEVSSNEEITKLTWLSYCDALAESKNLRLFQRVLEEYRSIGYEFGTECYNHILIDLAKLKDYNGLMKMMEEHHRTRETFSGTILSDGKYPEKDFYEQAMKIRQCSIAPSTFSDILYSIASDIKAETIRKNEIERLVAVASSVYNVYVEQIIIPFEQFVDIADQMKEQSENAILTRRSFQGIPWNDRKVIDVNYERLYSIIMRTNNPFMAMAKVYVAANKKQDALEIIEHGKQFKDFNEHQLSQLFDVKDTVVAQTLNKN